MHWSPIPAIAYAVLMIFAYRSQITKLIKGRDTGGIALPHFVLAFLAVTLRLLTVGMMIFETHSLTAVALAIADTVVWGGLLAIIILTIMHRRHHEEARR